MKYLIIILILIQTCFAQDAPPVIQQQIEEWAEANEKEEIDDDNRHQQLQYFKKHNINLNIADREDLEALFFLNSLQVFHLLEYRRILGQLIDIYELQAVPGFDLVTIQKILPYIKVESIEKLGSSVRNQLKLSNHQIIIRWSKTLERSKGFNRELNDHFLGDGNQVYLRYRHQSKYLQFGLTAEKDKGEQFFKGAQSKGFDFYSFHVLIKNRKKLRALALGDFVVNLGQGLVHWQAMGNGKGMQLLNAKREAPLLMSYRSVGEFNFLRGAAIQNKLGKLDMLAFVSIRKLTASVSDSSGTFSAFNTSGLHRTQKEMEDRNKIGLFSGGVAIQLPTRHGKLGLHTLYYRVSMNLEKSQQPYNHFIPSGKALYFLGLDYSKTYKNLHFFGELAFDKEKHMAYIHGMILSLDAKVDLALQFRKISKEFRPLFGNAFTENSNPGNEEGLFSGIVLKPIKGLIIQAFADIFSFPWLKYRVDAPSKGSEFLIALEYLPSRQSSFQLILRSKKKPLNVEVDNFQFPNLHIRQSLRFHWSREINKTLKIRSRFELTRFIIDNEVPETGSMLYIEGIKNHRRFDWGLRLQWFDTETYNSRIYSYEADVLYSSSITVMSDQGFRFYLNSKFELSRAVSLSARISQSIYSQKTTIGSGYNAINGNKLTDLRLQFLYDF
jgi:hypothetical protein